MTLEIIDDFNRLLEIQPEWSSFTRSVEGLSPFQLPEWLLTWWPRFGSGELHVFVFRQTAALAGIIPCFLHEWHGLRQLTLIGSGISDYLEPAIASEHCSAILNRLETHLYSHRNWDVCNWQDLSFDTPLRRLSSNVVEDTSCYVVPLTGSFEEYWKRRSKSLRQNVRRDRQKAESRAQFEFEVSAKPDPEPITALIRLHGARWRAHGQPGTIEANCSAEFLKDVAVEFARRDMLRIFSLRFEKRIAAVIFGFCYAGTLFNYLTAFDPAHEALGIGRTLLYESLRYSFEHRYQAWDFLRGDEPYKLWWGAQLVPKCRVIVTRTA